MRSFKIFISIAATLGSVLLMSCAHTNSDRTPSNSGYEEVYAYRDKVTSWKEFLPQLILVKKMARENKCSAMIFELAILQAKESTLKGDTWQSQAATTMEHQIWKNKKVIKCLDNYSLAESIKYSYEKPKTAIVPFLRQQVERTVADKKELAEINDIRRYLSSHYRTSLQFDDKVKIYEALRGARLIKSYYQNNIKEPTSSEVLFVRNIYIDKSERFHGEIDAGRMYIFQGSNSIDIAKVMKNIPRISPSDRMKIKETVKLARALHSVNKVPYIQFDDDANMGNWGAVKALERALKTSEESLLLKLQMYRRIYFREGSRDKADPRESTLSLSLDPEQIEDSLRKLPRASHEEVSLKQELLAENQRFYSEILRVSGKHPVMNRLNEDQYRLGLMKLLEALEKVDIRNKKFSIIYISNRFFGRNQWVEIDYRASVEKIQEIFQNEL